jgi:hypothetical protein
MLGFRVGGAHCEACPAASGQVLLANDYSVVFPSALRMSSTARIAV